MSVDDSVDDSRAPSATASLRTAAGVLAALHLLLFFVPILTFGGRTGAVVATVAAGSGLMLAATYWWLGQPGREQLRHPDRAVGLVASVPVLNCLVHFAAVGEMRQTATVMLAVVVLGALVTSRRVVTVLILGTELGWAALVPRLDPTRDQLAHALLGLVVATITAAFLHELRTRSDRRLSEANQRLEARVRADQATQRDLAAITEALRHIQAGSDPRIAIVKAAREIAGANAAHLIEVGDDEHLVIVASDGADHNGVQMRRDATSATAEVFRTGGSLFIPDPSEHPLVSPTHLALSGARSMLWQPITHRGVVTAVLSVTWAQRVPHLSSRLVRAVEQLATEASVALEYQRLLQQVAAHGTTDTLTALPNRRGWEDKLSGALDHARVSGQLLTVAMVDLDHFKAFNDAYGHVAGDAMLVDFGQAAREALRGGDVLARWGGEEFAIALPDCGRHCAEAVLLRVRGAVPNDQTCSIGFATWDGAESGQALVARADQALYTAKNAGRDRTVAALP